MTLPSLPTDNLYKFIALSGITLVVLYSILLYQADTQFADINVVNSVIGARLQNDLDDVENEYNKNLKNLENVCLSEGCQCTVTKLNGKINVKYVNGCKTNLVQDELLNVITESEIKVKQMKEKFRDYQDKHNSFDLRAEAWLKQKEWLFNMLFLPGIALALIGFVSWYFMVQRFQDEILKNQAKLDVKQ